jgi:hypothetical protein
MNSAMLVSLAMGLLPGFLLFTIVYTVILKVLARQLTFNQSLLISAVASTVMIVLLVAYFLSKASLGLDKIYDTFATLAAWCVLGAMITRLARNYGIKKDGWLGVGAKANLWLLAISWAVIAIVFAIKYFMPT